VRLLLKLPHEIFFHKPKSLYLIQLPPTSQNEPVCLGTNKFYLFALLKSLKNLHNCSGCAVSGWAPAPSTIQVLLVCSFEVHERFVQVLGISDCFGLIFSIEIKRCTFSEYQGIPFCPPSQAKPSMCGYGVKAFVQPKISRYVFGLWDRIVTKINPNNDYFPSKHILSTGFSYSDSERLT
jgi:hypothetical protein